MRASLMVATGLVGSMLALPTVHLSPVQALELEVKSSVTKVVVFPSGAQVVRSAKIDLVEGDQTIVLKGLPERLIARSLRVEGAGEASFEIGAVDSKKVLVELIAKDNILDKSERKKLEKEIERLGDEKAVLAARTRTAQTQRQLIEKLAQLPGQPPVGPLAGQTSSSAILYSADNWGEIFDLIGVRMALADDLILKYTRQQREKNEQIAKLRKRLAQQPARKERQMEVRVSITSKQAMKAGLIVKYQVREASWRPFYDARLHTGETGEKPSLSLVRRAGIRQWSGEDWKDVKISLSTTSPQKGAQAPVLRPKRLDLMEERKVALDQVAGGAYDKRTRGMIAQEMLPMAAPAPRMALKKSRRRVRALHRRAKTRNYAFQAVFEIAGKITILPKGHEKKVVINSEKIVPALKVKTVPKLNRTAFLYAKFTHKKEATPLLPGSVALYRDGTFAGNSALPLVPAGDDVELGFGADEAIKVVRNEIKRTKGKEGVWTTSKVDTQRYVIKVTNLHQSAMAIEVWDQIPFSVNEKVVVRLLPTSTKPSRQNIKDKRGILAWDFKLEAHKEKQIKLDYTISWPADKKLQR